MPVRRAQAFATLWTEGGRVVNWGGIPDEVEARHDQPEMVPNYPETSKAPTNRVPRLGRRQRAFVSPTGNLCDGLPSRSYGMLKGKSTACLGLGRHAGGKRFVLPL